MKIGGTVKEVYKPFGAKLPVAKIEMDTDIGNLEKYLDKVVDVEISIHREHRSLDANACMWACIGEIAAAIRSEPWSVYLYMLQRYGKYEYILIKPEAVQMLKHQCRTIKVIGERQVWDAEQNQYITMTEVLCFYGSSTYNTKEFSRLLDGIISEMKEMELETPTGEQIRTLIEDWEREHGQV